MRFSSSILLKIVLFLIIAFTVGLASGTPHLISYQGKATDNAGNPVTDDTYDVWFFLYTSSSGASYVWSDNASIKTTEGLFSYTLGSDPTSPLPDSIFSKYDSLFVGIFFEGEIMAPLKPLTSSPYAIRVNSIDGAKGGEVAGDLILIDTTIGPHAEYAEIMKDFDGTGGGYLQIHSSWSHIGFVVDGNSNNTGEPRTMIMGNDRFVAMNMADSGTNSVTLPTDAIEASEILDEPGVGSCVSTFVELTTSIQNLCGRTMFAPADGFVMVTATANVSIVHNNGTQSLVSFGVSDNISSYVTSAKINIILPANAPTGTYYYPVTSHSLFPISEGSHAYYILGSKSSITAEVYSIQFTEVYYPTAYTTVHNPVPPIGTELPLPLLNPEAERLEAETVHQNRIELELARLAAEVDKLKKEMQFDATQTQIKE
ncbi:MAG: hypothetical protein ABIJ12_06365 [bacterium]